MMMLRGTTNGFKFSGSFYRVGQPFAVVPLGSGTFYAVHPMAAKRTAKNQGAPGFWRVKK